MNDQESANDTNDLVDKGGHGQESHRLNPDDKNNYGKAKILPEKDDSLNERQFDSESEEDGKKAK